MALAACGQEQRGGVKAGATQYWLRVNRTQKNVLWCGVRVRVRVRVRVTVACGVLVIVRDGFKSCMIEVCDRSV